MRPDVIVIGLGSMGAAAAYHLANRGVRVLGFDRFAPPHEQGAHAGGSRIIRMAYAEGAEYVPLVRRSYELWRELEAAAGVPLLAQTGGLLLGPPHSQTVAGALNSARTHGLAHELLDAREVRRRFPAFTPSDGDIAVFEKVAGVLRPENAIAAQLELAASAGADLRYGVPVTGWRATVDGVHVSTVDGEIAADRLVISPGAWAPQLLADLAIPLVVQRRVQHYWQTTSEGYEPDRFPVWIWEYADGLAAYGLPAVDGAGAKAALHQGGEVVDPAVGPREATEAEVAAMREWLASRLPGLATGEWVGSKPCLYTLTPDEHFVLGRHPELPSVALAGGFSGHGFKFSPVVGEILADLSLTGSTSHPIELFAPGRFLTGRRAHGVPVVPDGRS